MTNGGPAAATTLRALREMFPRGRQLPEDVWWGRHRAIVVLLWLHVAAIPVFGIVRGVPPLHALAEGGAVGVAALFASLPRLNRRTRTAATSIGLLSSSAVFVHLSGGVIEVHFHFFVMVTVVALYQDWLPFLAAIGYVFVHHGLIGALDPTSVYNHPAALANPWRWAAVHALFISGASVACLVTWRLDEHVLAQRMEAEAKLREESRIVRALHDVGKTLAAELDVERVVQYVTDASTRLTGAAFGAFFYNVSEPDGESYMLYTLAGAPMDSFESFGLPRKTELFRETFEGTAVLRLDDVTKDPRYGHNAPHRGMPAGHLPVTSYLAVPVTSRRGEVIGGLFFGHPEPARFDEADERIVVGVAAQAAVAIDNARLYESERQSRLASESAQRRLALLAGASRVLTSSLEVDTILRGFAGLIAPSVADLCVVDLVEPDGSIRRVVSAGAPSLDRLRFYVEGEEVGAHDASHPVVQAIRFARPNVFVDIPIERVGEGVADEAFKAELLADPTTSTIIVPLPGRHEILGALSVATTASSGKRLTHDEDLPLIEELARRAAIAIENARLYARQRTLAETLQHSLLPERLPEVPGIETAARYLAGGPGVDVGGDWYDLIRIGGDGIALVMGDVVGRGERAASLMGQLRNAVRAYALDGLSPSEVVGRLNRMLHDIDPDNMATMVYAVFELDTGTLRFVNAGHPPPLVVSPDGAASYLESGGGVPIGAVPRMRYTETMTTLTPGSTLVLFTDGLVEDRVTPLDEGLGRLSEVASAGAESLDDLCDSILARMLVGRDKQDDIAVLALRLQPLGDRLEITLPAQPNVLAQLRSALRRWLVAAGANETETYEILVAAGEACSNAIQHAAGLSRTNFTVVAERNGAVQITVRDQGGWRQPRPSSGGRGLEVIRRFMDSVDIDVQDVGKEVRMRRVLSIDRAQAVGL